MFSKIIHNITRIVYGGILFCVGKKILCYMVTNSLSLVGSG